MNGVPMEQIVKYARVGRFKIDEKYPEPHRDENGKIMIENCLLYDQDCEIYSPEMIYKMAQRGRYNLSHEELIKERQRIEEDNKRKYYK